jgi:hypothetical protein
MALIVLSLCGHPRVLVVERVQQATLVLFRVGRQVAVENEE